LDHCNLTYKQYRQTIKQQHQQTLITYRHHTSLNPITFYPETTKQHDIDDPPTFSNQHDQHTNQQTQPNLTRYRQVYLRQDLSSTQASKPASQRYQHPNNANPNNNTTHKYAQTTKKPTTNTTQRNVDTSRKSLHPNHDPNAATSHTPRHIRQS
jgi:hypothetical protein